MNSQEKNLWGMTKRNAPQDAFLQRIETGSTGRGIPDVWVGWRGHSAWVELKVVQGKRVLLEPEQVGWHYRCARAACRGFILARERKQGPRVGNIDRLYLWPSEQVVGVKEKGIAHEEQCQIFEKPFDWLLIFESLVGMPVRPG